MSRIEAPQRPAWWIRLLFFLARKRYGKDMRPLQLAAHVPSFLLPFLMTNQFAHLRGTLPESTRLLAMLLVAEVNRCDWCVDFGRSLATRDLRQKAFRVRDFETSPDFTDAERAALRYTAAVTGSPVEVTDETFAALRHHFTERQVVELTFAVAIENFFNRVNAPLGIEAEGFCAVAPLERAA